MFKLKYYIDKDKEERWLNDMAQSGWAFCKFHVYVYHFEPCEPGEYHYQIDLTEDLKSEDFLEFLQEADVETVDRFGRWVYLRKKTNGDRFELYSDSESKLEHYRRIRTFTWSMFFVELICFGMELNASIQTGFFFFRAVSVVLAFLTVILLIVGLKYTFKMQLLKKELL